MENKELLLAISDLLEEKLEQKLEEKLEQKLEQKFDEKLTPIRNDIAELKEDVAVLKKDVERLNGDVVVLQNGMVALDNKQTKLDLLIENQIQLDIKLLIENFLPAAKRYHEQSEKIEMMQRDINLMKSVIIEHSELLHKFA